MVIDLDSGGQWRLVAGNGNRWSLEEGAVANPAACVRFTVDAAWRSFTGAAVPPGGVTYTGPTELTEPILDVRSIIA